jgi:hypothetical protein
MNINIQRFIITTHPVTGIGIINHQLPVIDDGLYAPYNVFTCFNHYAVKRILRKDDVNILFGNDGIEIGYDPCLLNDNAGAGKTMPDSNASRISTARQRR